MTRLYLTEELKTLENAIIVENVYSISIGSKLVFIKAIKGDKHIIRAFGRAEFEAVVIEDNKGALTTLVLAEVNTFDARYQLPEQEEPVEGDEEI